MVIYDHGVFCFIKTGEKKIYHWASSPINREKSLSLDY